MREAAGEDVTLLGCGCPLGAAVGHVDAMRASADAGPSWLPALPLPPVLSEMSSYFEIHPFPVIRLPVVLF